MLSKPKPPLFVTFVAFCKISSVFVASVISPYCDLILAASEWGQVNRLHHSTLALREFFSVLWDAEN